MGRRPEPDRRDLRSSASIRRVSFQTDAEAFLVLALTPGKTAIPDNPGSHKARRIRQPVAAAGATRLLLTPDSPDVTPIETGFRQDGAPLRQAAERTVASPRQTIGGIRDINMPEEARTDFAAARYDPDRAQSAPA